MPDTRGDAPVFVLSASRSGSTLMRFILDSHPDLACPPETGVSIACAQLINTWDVLENADGGEHGGAEAAGRPGSPRALAAVRDTVDGIYDRYLQRRGKRRWCDKSLNSYREAEITARLYPEAKFICLYRHCMDVIASGVQACPWGLHRFGFDGFAGRHPGNSVAAVGSYWLAATESIMAFEERHPEACLRVRYEDLVTAPEGTAAAIFSFLGEEPVPDIAETCFRVPHESNGPGDEEIWFTGGITADSVGCGVRVPAAALLPEVGQRVNEVLALLGYRAVDDEWNALVGRAEVRADAAGRGRPEPEARGGDRAGVGEPGRHGECVWVARVITDRLRSVPDHERREASTVWPIVAGQTVAIVVEDVGGEHAEVRWSFAASPDASACSSNENDDPVPPVCTIIANPPTWRALLSGGANLVTEMTAGRLRCANRRDGQRIRSDEVHAIGWLLGLTRVPVIRDPGALVPSLRSGMPKPARRR